MNKLVLEKLIHAYQLMEQDGPLEADGKEMTNSTYAFLKHFGIPPFIDSINKGQDVGLSGKEIHATLKAISHEIQQAGKFYNDQRFLKDVIDYEQLQKIMPEVPLILPYEKTFLQVDTDYGILNLLIIEHEKEEITYMKGDGDKTIKLWKNEHEYEEKYTKDVDISLSCTVVCIPYLPDQNCFMYDPIPTNFMFHLDSDKNLGSYSYWLLHEDLEISKYCDLTQDEHNRYTNKYWDQSRNAIADIMYNYFVMMHYPNLADQAEVKGIKPNIIRGKSKYKASELRMKPAWEHKTLKISMTQQEREMFETGRMYSSGKKFHSVRKHIRRLSNGKHTIVKSHFRGDKSKGVIQKDYKVAQ
tara:strand:- start:489 stop:1559 length:1071 start_codon:yes stop_codon:yes gene_type:complete